LTNCSLGNEVNQRHIKIEEEIINALTPSPYSELTSGYFGYNTIHDKGVGNLLHTGKIY
jgi:hypothetical protein